MPANTLSDRTATLGSFLRERRARLAPPPGHETRRRTPGLRREEVATRAGVSLTWYTWLEQGRGGPPSAEVLERLVRALELDGATREMLFLLAQGRPPPIQPLPPSPVPAATQRLLDRMDGVPAIVKTPVWDVVAWNEAASAVLGDYAAMPIADRNIVRRVFDDATVRASLPDWEANARFLLSVFRIDVARAGGCPGAAELAAELSETSADFRRLWADSEPAPHGIGRKRIARPPHGLLTLEYSAYPIEGAEGLSLLAFTPVTEADTRIVAILIAERDAAQKNTRAALAA